MRLIDADALSARMYHDAFETDSDMQRWDSGCWIRYKMFENALEDAPTIEPERKSGEWIESNLVPARKGQINGRLFVCSVCDKGWVKHDRSMDGINFCPNCGADMREDKE